jgi:LAO/AO transport system kinase
LLIAGAGDELQGIKRGLLEVAHVVGINKADGDNKLAADKAKEQLSIALHIMKSHDRVWQTPVVTCSVQDDEGIDIIWQKLCDHKQKMIAAGIFEDQRHKQQLKWMWQLIDEKLRDAFHTKAEVKALLSDTEREVVTGTITAGSAASKLLQAFGL